MHRTETITVAIVDDDTNRHYFHELAVTKACADLHLKINFLFFTDPDEAVAAIKNTRNSIALVLTDLDMKKDPMPGREGIRVIEAANAEQIPVVLITDNISGINGSSVIEGIDNHVSGARTEAGDRIRSMCIDCLPKTPLIDIGNAAKRAIQGDFSKPDKDYHFSHASDSVLQEA